MNDAQRLYLHMWVSCLHRMTSPRLPCRVRFFDDVDTGGTPYLLCVVKGPDRDDGTCEIWGSAYYPLRGFIPPEEPKPEVREELARVMEDDAASL